MTDKDKEAFEKYKKLFHGNMSEMNDDYGNRNAGFMKGWQAACEHKQQELERAIDALTLAVEAASFFSKFADCTKDTWSCRCEFCRDTKQTKSLIMARKVLDDLKGSK